jgi:hypothetical protein
MPIVITPEGAAAIVGALISVIVSTVGLWAAMTKLLPDLFERREKLWEQKQQSVLADAQVRRDEDIEQRKAESEWRQAQIKQEEAFVMFASKLIETNAQFAAAVDNSAKQMGVYAKSAAATEHALTDNTIALNVFGENFIETFNKGSIPMRDTHDIVVEFRDHGVPLVEAVKLQLNRMEELLKDIDEKILPCVEARATLDTTALAVITEARRLIELFDRDALLKIEDKRKTDSRPIPPIVDEKTEGSAA